MKAHAVVEAARYYASLADLDVARTYLTQPRRRRTQADPLREAIRWICHAQDAAGDGGVARSYSLAYNQYFQRRGWMAAYPETTGYIIPTMFDYARRAGDREVFERAVRMAEWECRVQMDNGAVRGGTVDAAATPAIFNTGQVIFGWLRAFQETAQESFLAAAVRAGDYLVANQAADGAWRRHLSDFAIDSISSYTYNTRTAWALLLLSTATGTPVYRDAAIRNVEFALTEQAPNGWFRHNCLYDPDRPLLHTIAYALRGILEVGRALGEERYVQAARRGADAVLAQQAPDGRLAGRFDDQWRPAVKWSCLTGNAQMAVIWGLLFEMTGDADYLRGLTKANAFLRSVQWLGTGRAGLDGGIAGSYPLHGAYGRFEVLNWAVKFFADALMMEESIARARQALTAPEPSGTRETPPAVEAVDARTAEADRLRYDGHHWAREEDEQAALAQYLRLGDKPYNRTKFTLFRALTGELEGRKVLDYGGGAGIMAVPYAKAGAEVVLVDAEPNALRTARLYARQEGVDARLVTIESLAVPQDLKDERFDIILAKDIVEHIPDDQGVLRDLHACLRPGGVLLLSTQNCWSSNYVVEGSYQRFWRGNLRWLGWDQTHVRFYSPVSLSRKLRQAGYRPRRWASVFLIPYDLLSWFFLLKVSVEVPALRYVDLTLGRLFPFNRLGWNVIVKSVKP